ncbi:MAG: magnesium/cobalt transporter CorA [Gemmatimonadales bacterium]
MSDRDSQSKSGAKENLQRRGVIDCAAYVGGRRARDVALQDISEVLCEEGLFLWIGLYEPDEELLREVQREFGLHDLAIEDAHTAHQRAKLEQYEDSLFTVLRTAQYTGEPRCLEFGETHLFVGRRYVVSVRHGSMRSHVGLRQRCEATPHLLCKGPGFVLYALMDFIVDQYLPIVETFEEELEELEEEIFGETFSRETTGRIYRLKRDLLATRRAVAPLVEVCNRLMRFDLNLIHEDTRPYFRDVQDHVMRINEMIDNLRELLTTALEANLSLLSVKQNEDTKRLAAWAAIIAVPTMVAGIYGMNFHYMPELNFRYGYLLAVGLMGAVCAGLYFSFKRSGWL